MSSTNRDSDRDPFDYYPTQPWMVARLLERLALPRTPMMRWLEPCAGDGAIIRAVNNHSTYSRPRWTAVDIQERFRSQLSLCANQVIIADALSARAYPGQDVWDVAITNPSFAIAEQLTKLLFAHAREVVVLQRLNWLGGPRPDWMRNNMPDLFVLPDRCAFDERGADSIEYGWFYWPEGPGRPNGRITILDSTPLEVRRTERAEAIAMMRKMGVPPRQRRAAQRVNG